MNMDFIRFGGRTTAGVNDGIDESRQNQYHKAISNRNPPTVTLGCVNDPNGTCTYGLECLTDRQGAWVQWDLIEDVSPSRESVLSLAARCNALGLSPLHFRDVVLDSINT